MIPGANRRCTARIWQGYKFIICSTISPPNQFRMPWKGSCGKEVQGHMWVVRSPACSQCNINSLKWERTYSTNKEQFPRFANGSKGKGSSAATVKAKRNKAVFKNFFDLKQWRFQDFFLRLLFYIFSVCGVLPETFSYAQKHKCFTLAAWAWVCLESIVHKKWLPKNTIDGHSGGDETKEN